MDKELSVFRTGEENTAFSKYFIGKSYLEMLSKEQVLIANVTFEPGCRNNWHIHMADEGGGQILLVTAGRGWYQEWGKDAIELKPGDTINIKPGVKHWHGASKDQWMQHIAIEVPWKNGKTEWCEPVSEEEYSRLK